MVKLEAIKLRRKIYRLKLKHKSLLPEFKRYDWDKYYRLERQDRWRRTRGQDNKTRLKVKGFPRPVSAGYRTPKVVRDLHPSGLREVLINNLRDLDKLKGMEDKIIVRISSKVGLRLRGEILKRAQELGLKVCNGE